MFDFGIIVSRNKNRRKKMLEILKKLALERKEKYLLFMINNNFLPSFTVQGIVIEKNEEKAVYNVPVPKIILNTVIFRKQENKKLLKHLRMQENILLINPMNKLYTAKIYEILNHSDNCKKYILERLMSISDTDKFVAISKNDSTKPWYFFAKGKKSKYIQIKDFNKSIIDETLQKKIVAKLVEQKYDFLALNTLNQQIEFKRIYCQKNNNEKWLTFDNTGKIVDDYNLYEMLNYLKWFLPDLANCYLDLLLLPQKNRFFLIKIGGWDPRIIFNKKIASMYIENAIAYMVSQRRENKNGVI